MGDEKILMGDLSTRLRATGLGFATEAADKIDALQKVVDQRGERIRADREELGEKVMKIARRDGLLHDIVEVIEGYEARHGTDSAHDTLMEIEHIVRLDPDRGCDVPHCQWCDR